MKSYVIWCVLFLGPFSLVFATCEDHYRQKTYVKARDCYEAEQDKEKLLVLERQLQMLQEDPQLSFREKVYISGFWSWKKKNILDARNYWMRYVELCQRSCEQAESVRFFEVQDYLRKIKNHIPKRQTPEPRPIKSKKKWVQSTTKPRNSSQLIDQLDQKAELAILNGQFERALQLYQLGLEINPDSVLLRKKLESLEKKIN